MITTAAATRGTVITHCVITSSISRRTAGAQHIPQRLGALTRNATATKRTHPLQVHTAPSDYPPSGLERNRNDRHIERQRAGGGITRGGPSVPIRISGTMGI
jgi:hypothetical protein